MHPIVIFQAIRALVKLPSTLKNMPSSDERQRATTAAEAFRRHQAIAESSRVEKAAQVGPEAKSAYEKGMELWKGTMLKGPDREKAAGLIKEAARGGHSEAQMMAKMHGINF